MQLQLCCLDNIFQGRLYRSLRMLEELADRDIIPNINGERLTMYTYNSSCSAV